MSKTIAIGDVHGCYHTLLKLLRKLPKDSNLIFLGDLCNRGKYSKEVIEFVIQNNHQCLMGNHEALLYKYLRGLVLRENNLRKNTFGLNSATIKSYDSGIKLKRTIKKHFDWVESLPSYIELELNNKKLFLTHGFGLPYYARKDKISSKIPLYSNRLDNKKYIKDWEDFSKYKIINIFGHCVFKKVLFGTNYIGIDTGCVGGNKLSAIDLETFKVYEQKVDLKDI
jgi:serine/threonine protein phosphatase 1